MVYTAHFFFQTPVCLSHGVLIGVRVCLAMCMYMCEEKVERLYEFHCPCDPL